MTLETITIADIKQADGYALDKFVATLEPGSTALFYALTLIVNNCKDQLVASHVFRGVGIRSQQVAQ